MTRGIVAFLPAVLIAVLELPLLWPIPAVGDNFQFWAAGHMVVTGLDPYDRASWVAAAAYGPTPGGVAANTVPLNLAITQQVWLYPPQTAFLFAPFGALPVEVGVPLLHLFVAVSAFVGITAAAWALGLRGPALGIALLLALVSQPFVIAVRNGHPIGLLVIGATLLFRGLATREPRRTALGAALLTIKPQLVLPIAVVALAIALWRRDLRSLAAMAVGAIAITLPFEILTPFPFAALASSTTERLNVDLSSLPALARDLGGGTPLALVLIAMTVGLCVLAFRWVAPSERQIVVGASLGVLSLALSPYAHDYDMLIGVPAAMGALALTAGRRGGATARVAASLGLVLAPWILFYWWPLVGESGRRFLGGPLGAVPIVLALTLAWSAFVARDRRIAAVDLAPNPPQREVA